MITPIGRPTAPRVERVEGIELQQLHAGAPQCFQKRRRRVRRADRVVDDGDLHARGAAIDEEFAQLLACTANLLEHIEFKMHAASRTANGREHRGESLISVAQQLYRIAGQQVRLDPRMKASSIAGSARFIAARNIERLVLPAVTHGCLLLNNGP